MSKKRGVIEIQFNWIFVLIVGGLIILFFLGVVRTQKKVAETKISATISTDLRAILSGVEVSTQTASLIDIPKTEIEFDCEGYRVGGIGGMRPIASFSPNLIKSNKLMSWAVPWSVPYRVMNLVYLTSPDVRYIIVDDSGAVGDDSLADKLYSTLPQDLVVEDGQERLLMNKEIILDGVDPGDKNNYKVRYVFFKNNPSMIPNIPSYFDKLRGDVTAIEIGPIPAGSLEGYGKIIFYKQESGAFDFAKSDETESTIYYFGKPSLIAAIFAEDVDSYTCNMQRAFKKLWFITKIYLDRTNALKNSLDLPMDCDSSYTPGIGFLETIRDNAVLSSQGPLISADILPISNATPSLADKNDMAQKLSCPEIY